MVSSRNNHEEPDDVSPVEKKRPRSPRLGDFKGTAVKGGVILAGIVLVVALFFMVSSTRSRARFVLSDHEIQDLSADLVSQKAFSAGSKVFFLMNKRNGNKLNASHFVMEISREDGGKYVGARQISFEIDKDFPKISSYIPVDYFGRKGKYMVKSFLDGKPVSTEEIQVE